jgi:hypothetical protein
MISPDLIADFFNPNHRKSGSLDFGIWNLEFAAKTKAQRSKSKDQRPVQL